MKPINLINSKHKKKVISYEDLDGGFFPWESSGIEKGNKYRKRKTFLFSMHFYNFSLLHFT